MFTTITRQGFIDAFLGSETLKEQFSVEALETLYDYHSNIEEETGEHIELDIVAISCDWCEYETMQELEKAYNTDEGFDLEACLTTARGSILVPWWI